MRYKHPGQARREHAGDRPSTKEDAEVSGMHRADDEPNSGDVPSRAAQDVTRHEDKVTGVDQQGSSPSKAPEIVRQTTVRVLSERIRLLGVDRSGAYEHYNLQLSLGFPIRTYEIAILDLVRRHLPNLRSYHEIGSGLGTLPFMLAHDGFAAVGVERDDRRHLTSMTILRELASQLPHIESNCRLIGASFPHAVADLDVSDSMAILTDFVATQSPQEYRKLCAGLARYRFVLLDLQRFCVKRESEAEHERLIEELTACGLSLREETIDLAGEGYYRLFERRSPAVPFADGDAAAAPDVAAEAALRVGMDSPGDQLRSNGAARGELTVSPSAELPAQIPVARPEPTPIRLTAIPQQAKRRRFGGLLTLSALLVIGIPTLIAAAYYGFGASDQYVTTLQFAVRGPSQIAGRAAGASSAFGPSAMSPDAFVVTDYINSPQAMGDVEKSVDLTAMFSKPGIDFLSRLSPEASAEHRNAYWAKMVAAHFDLVSGNVSVSVRAFTPEDSLKLAQALVATSDAMFRRLNLKAQQDFVRIADDNLARAQQQLAEARQAVVTFREKSGLVEPDKTSQSGSAIIDDLRKQLVGFQAQHTSIKTVSPNSPTLIGLSAQIAALEKQIVVLQSQMRDRDQPTSSALTAVTPEALGKYQSLELNRQFAEKEYTEALALRSQAHLTAQNQQSYLALYVEPTLPQKSLYPNRPRAIATVVLAAAAVWFIGMLLAYAVRDHLA